MTYAYAGEGALDYLPCRYGTSRLLFRGPVRSLDAPYVAVLGGTETYGKYVPSPYPALIEAATGVRMINLGCNNAGLDVYLNEPAVLEIAGRAEATVVQMVGAQNVTNRYYTVHPRRNDRFLGATPMLKSIFREVDFTEFNFTRHMLLTLQAVSADRFEVLAEELRAAWVGRMKQLLARLPGRTVLLWMANQRPPDVARRANLRLEPLLVDTEMVAAVRPHATAYVEGVSSEAARNAGPEGMAFPPMEAPAAAGLPGPAVHAEVAALLAPVVQSLL